MFASRPSLEALDPTLEAEVERLATALRAQLPPAAHPLLYAFENAVEHAVNATWERYMPPEVYALGQQQGWWA